MISEKEPSGKKILVGFVKKVRKMKINRKFSLEISLYLVQLFSGLKASAKWLTLRPTSTCNIVVAGIYLK